MAQIAEATFTHHDLVETERKFFVDDRGDHCFMMVFHVPDTDRQVYAGCRLFEGFDRGDAMSMDLIEMDCRQNAYRAACCILNLRPVDTDPDFTWNEEN